MSALTPDQYNFLASPLHASRVQKANGHSHLAAWDIRRHLIRCFGYGGWDVETLALDLVREIEHEAGSVTYANGGSNNRTVWTVVYRAQVRLIVRTEDDVELCHYDDAAAGDAVNQPSLGDAHDLAAKTALSQALKRCAVNLGDQYGLSLYKAGEAGASVMRTLTAPGASDDAGAQSYAPAEVYQADTPNEPRSAPRVNAHGTDLEEAAGSRRRTGRLFALLGKAGCKDKGDRIALYRSVTGREDITSTNDLTPFEIAQICRSVEAALAEEHAETPA